MAQHFEPSEICPIFLRIPAAEIVLLKSLLESYELLGELRTLDPDVAIVAILSLRGTAETVRQMLASEQDKVDWREIDCPEEYSGDWLVQEVLASQRRA